MLYAHGSDLCHELELRHAMANCFEALMGALLLDGGIKVADKVFAEALFLENSALKDVSLNPHSHAIENKTILGRIFIRLRLERSTHKSKSIPL